MAIEFLGFTLALHKMWESDKQKMIDSVKKALADYEKYLKITDENNIIKVEITGYIAKAETFNAISEIIWTQYNAEYTPFQKNPKRNAYFTVQKAQPTRVGTVKDSVIVALRGYAEEAEQNAESFRRMADDLVQRLNDC